MNESARYIECDVCRSSNEVKMDKYPNIDLYKWHRVNDIDICPQCYAILQRAIESNWIDAIIHAIMA